MGRPKRCASKQKPYISYSTQTAPIATTTTIEPVDYSKYIVIPESGIECPSATTTTTTIYPLSECQVYVADLIIGDSCGPYVINLYGNHAEYFSIINNKMFLEYYPPAIGSYSVIVSLEDPANRFDPVQKTYTLVVTECE